MARFQDKYSPEDFDENGVLKPTSLGTNNPNKIDDAFDSKSKTLTDEDLADSDENGVSDYLKSSRRKQLEEATEIAREIQSLSPSAIIELFVLDLTYFGEGYCYFHAGTNEIYNPVVWQGKEYLALPIEAEGFEATTQGTLPRPKLRLANMKGLFSAGVREFDDFVGCKLIRKRTFKRFLDKENFAGGINPEADPNQHFPDEVWYIEQKITETKWLIEWELSSPLDLQGVQLPRRQIIQNTCCWKYRSAECGYTGDRYFNADNKPVENKNDDFCAKRLSSCKCRFVGRPLPFGAFPGANRYNA